MGFDQGTYDKASAAFGQIEALKQSIITTIEVVDELLKRVEKLEKKMSYLVREEVKR